MKHEHRFSSQEQEQLRQAASNQEAREFASAEEMLRHDALHTPVPPAIAHRLRESIAKLPPPTPPGGAAG